MDIPNSRIDQRAIIGLVLIVGVGTLALLAAFGTYSLFFYVVVLEDFDFSKIVFQFWTGALAAGLLVPLELYMQLRRRRSLVQYSFVLLIIAFVLDTIISVTSFYQAGNQFFGYLSNSIGLDRFSMLLLANEVLASLIAILVAIVVLIAFQRLPLLLNLIDHRADQNSNRR